MPRGLQIDQRVVQIARGIRKGIQHEHLASRFGARPQEMNAISDQYKDVPDTILATLERLLRDRERLKALISRLARS